MKIGLARRGYSPWGGAEAYLARFATALAAAGHTPVLLGSPEWPPQAWPGGERVALPARSPRAFADAVEPAARAAGCERLFSMERLWRCDLYRAGDGVHRAWLARRAAAEPRWKGWVRTLQPKHRQLLELENRLYSPEGARAIIANSRLVKEEITHFYGYPAERIHVVYNGLPTTEPAEPGSRERLRAQWGVGEGDYVLLFAGSGWERKGLAYALRALAEVRGCQPHLVVAGRGSRRGLPAAPRVHFEGPVRGMAAHYAAADAFILPTLYDPFSNAALEALQTGLPVITTAANGFSEIIAPGQDGEVVADPADTPALARAIEAWADPARRTAARPRLAELAAAYTVEGNVRSALTLLLG